MKYLLLFAAAVFVLTSCNTDSDQIIEEKPLFLNIASSSENVYIEGSEVSAENTFFSKTIIENGYTKLLSGCQSINDNNKAGLEMQFIYNGAVKGKTQNIIPTGKYTSAQLTENLSINLKYIDLQNNIWSIDPDNITIEILNQEAYASRIDGTNKNLISLQFSAELFDLNGNVQHFTGHIETIIDGKLN